MTTYRSSLLLPYKKQRGFTLLEMIIVIAIIGILTTLGIPNYQRYTQRAKFIEVIQAIGPYKTGITLCAYQQGDLTFCTQGQNNVPVNFKNKVGGYVDKIIVQPEGVIVATSKNIKLDKKDSFTYTLKPILQPNGTCQWTVDSTASNSCQRYHLC